MDTGRVVLGLVFVLCTINSISTSDLDSMESLVELYSGAGQQPSTSGDDRYFGKHGTIQFEQVSTLNSMALAKTGDRLATRLRLKLATLQVILPCPPPPTPHPLEKIKKVSCSLTVIVNVFRHQLKVLMIENTVMVKCFHELV